MRYSLLGSSAVALTLALASFSQADASVKVGSVAPPLSGKDVSGTHVDLSDFKGKWVYVDFWATWCQPCMKSLPGIVELSKSTRSSDQLEIIGVSLDDASSSKKVNNTLSKLGITYPVIFEGQGSKTESADVWGVTAIPATFLIDPEGRVAGLDIHPEFVSEIIARGSSTESRQGQPTRARQRGSAEDIGLPPAVVTSTASMLADSPSTGNPKLRDLLLQTDLNSLSSLRQFRVTLLVGNESRNGNTAYSLWRYDIRLIDAPAGSRMPLLTEIKLAPGKLDRQLAQQLKGKKIPGKTHPAMPSISATIDAITGLQSLVIPVPVETTEVLYGIAPYDSLTKTYLSGSFATLESL